MTKKQPLDTKNVRGVHCEMISPEQWQWKMGVLWKWTYELWGRRLYVENEVVQENIRSLADAVLISMGYEICFADIEYKQSLQGQAKKDMEGRTMILPFRRPERGEG